MGPLKGKVAIVAGATRGAGRGIACALGDAGATVYCTGRSTRGNPSSIGRPETIEETAEMVSARGGVGIWAQVDHTNPEQVKALFERIKEEQDGCLDILVNDISGDWHVDWKTSFGRSGQRFWKHSLEKGLLVQQAGVHSHIITCLSDGEHHRSCIWITSTIRANSHCVSSCRYLWSQTTFSTAKQHT